MNSQKNKSLYYITAISTGTLIGLGGCLIFDGCPLVGTIALVIGVAQFVIGIGTIRASIQTPRTDVGETLEK